MNSLIYSINGYFLWYVTDCPRHQWSRGQNKPVPNIRAYILVGLKGSMAVDNKKNKHITSQMLSKCGRTMRKWKEGWEDVKWDGMWLFCQDLKEWATELLGSKWSLSFGTSMCMASQWWALLGTVKGSYAEGKLACHQKHFWVSTFVKMQKMSPKKVSSYAKVISRALQ